METNGGIAEEVKASIVGRPDSSQGDLVSRTGSFGSSAALLRTDSNGSDAAAEHWQKARIAVQSVGKMAASVEDASTQRPAWENTEGSAQSQGVAPGRRTAAMKRRSIIKTQPKYNALGVAESFVLKSRGAADPEPKMQRVRFHIESEKKKAIVTLFKVWGADSVILSRWQIIMVIPMVYEMWAAGFRIALDTPYENTLRVGDIISDILFVVDGIFSCNTALKEHHDILNTSRKHIIRHYFTNSFPRMLLPAIIYWASTLWISGGLKDIRSGISGERPQADYLDKNLCIWWIASLPRLYFRSRRLLDYCRSMDMNLEVSVNGLQVFKLVLVILMVSHWIGSLWFFSTRFEPKGSPTTWLYDIKASFPGYRENDSKNTWLGEAYLLCFYRGLDGVASLGYVGIVPRNSFEVILSIVVHYLSIYVTAYILGSLFHYMLLSHKDSLREAQSKKMEDLEDFMVERRLPLATRKKLLDYFQFQYKKAVQRKASAALKLPQSLEVKVANARFRPTLQKCCNKGSGKERGSFFGCSVQFLNTMVTKLRPVFLMPGDQFIRASDMVLELCFVSSGYAEVMDGDVVKRIIRSDIDAPSIVGEVSFFLGVQQQHSVRAPTSSDIELLVLNKEAADDLFRDYPEQQEIITTNILAKYSMDSKGDDLENEAMEDDEDTDALALRIIIKDTVKRRHDEAFQALAWAVTSGDLEEVRRMLRKGVGINTSNYDGKTVLHMAAAEGNYRVVELLLGEKADKNAKDRWGNTALQDAINNNQRPVVQLLAHWKSELNAANAAGRLCDAASAGDLDTLKLILEHGVDPNIGDYDARTPLHLASAEGQDKAVQYLISKGADVNFKDRWGATPLQDAVQSGHLQVAEQILSRGGVMTTSMGPIAMCNAANEGDVRYLKLLIRCGVNPDIGDYDSRCPMHLAASEGRLLAVSYLLGVSANPNCKDRWDGTPMDDCVRGGTMRHLQCAKLLQCYGGIMQVTANTSMGRQATAALLAMDIEEVRKAIKLLVDHGLDTKKPDRATQQQCVIAFDASVRLIVPLYEISRVFAAVTNLLKQTNSSSQEMFNLDDEYALIGRFIDETVKDLEVHRQGGNMHEDHVVQIRSLEGDAREFFRILKSNEDRDTQALDQFFDSEMDEYMLACYAELDDILSEIERDFQMHHSRSERAKAFNRALMGLHKVEEMWHMLCISFDMSRGNDIEGEVVHESNALASALEFCGLNFTEEETRQIFIEATDGLEVQEADPEIILCGSATFHSRLIMHESDDVAQLLMNSSILSRLSWNDFQLISSSARRIPMVDGQVIRLKERSIVAVMSGSLVVTYVKDDVDETMVDIGRNAVVGEAWGILDVARITTIMATAPSTLIVVPWTIFAFLFQQKPELYLPFSRSFVIHAVDGKLRPFEADMIKALFESDKSKKGGARARKQLQKDKEMLSDMDGFDNVVRKDYDQRLFDASVLEVMQHCRSSCCPSWGGSPIKEAAVFFMVWKMRMKSQKKTPIDYNEPTSRRAVIQEGFEVMNDTWNIVSNGTKTIFFSQLQGLKEHLGEVGSFFFESAFPNVKMHETLDFEDWCTCWLRYVNGDEGEEINDIREAERQKIENSSRPGSATSAASKMSKMSTASTQSSRRTRRKQHRHHTKQIVDTDKKIADHFDDLSTQSNFWIVNLLANAYHLLYHTPITPLLESPGLADAYAPCYSQIAGDLKAPLDRSRVQDFLKVLLIDFKQKLTLEHVTEFMELFCTAGAGGATVTWIDIERGLREKSTTNVRPNSLFMSGTDSVFNPQSPFIRSVYTLNQIVALYHFIHVPVRICFDPYPSMTAWNFPPIVFDLAADVFVVLSILLNFNTAYLNKKTKIVKERKKIARNYLSRKFPNDALCFLPLDWLSHWSGGSRRLSSCLRLPKMLYIVSASSERNEGFIQWRKFGDLYKTYIMIFVTIHFLACIWYFLGNDVVFEDQFTWYRPPSQGAEFDYTGLSEGRDTFVEGYSYFGGILDEDSSPWFDVWRRYILCFYWITTTLSTVGVIGDMLPKNYGELVFVIFVNCIRLTLFNLIIGQISATVLQGDEKLMKAREELGAVESYLNSFDFADDLKIEIKRYFRGAAANASISAAEIFDSVSQSLRFEMSSELARNCLDNCTLFAGCSKQMKDAIKGLLREVHFTSEEYVVQINTVAHDMFFIMSGKFEQLTADADGQLIVDSTVGRGGSVGVLAAYFGIRYLFSVRATSVGGPCLCLRLARNQLMPILKAYPDDEEVIAQNAMSDFQKVKYEKSVAGGSVKGRSDKGRSVQSRGGHRGVALEVEDNASDDEGSEQSMKTGYHSDEGGGEQNMVDVIITSGIEQRLASLQQRRKQERISQFCSAASRGEIPKLMRTMRNGVHIDETDTNGRTALHCAASEGRLECVRFLLESSASLNIQDKYKNTPLNDAVRHQHDTVAAELRRYGAASVQLPGYEMGVLMCTFGFEGDKVQLERMLANGVDVNISDYDKRTALHLASSQGHLQVVEYLLERQADVNSTDRLGFSPLVDALRHDRSEVQKLLRSKGGQLLGMEVSVELCNAAAVGDVPRMKALIENGANPNAGDYDSRTALHLAASNGETSALDYILRCIENINVNPLDRLGGTPLDDANRHGHAVAIAMLEAAGGLRHDNDVLKANAETLRSESELLQRQQRSVKVQDLLNASPETKSCSWIKGKCGKLLPNQLNDLLITYKDLKADLTEVTRAMVKFNGYWAGQKYIAQRKGALKKYVDIARKSGEYNQIVEYAGSLCDSIATWQAVSQNALEVMLEDLPHCKSTVIFSKGYREEVKNNLETFAYVRKVLTYLKFLLCKIPEVRIRSEEDDLKREQENTDEHLVNTKAT